MRLFSLKEFKPARRREPEPLIVRTDIHSHLCPGIDDGVQSANSGAKLVAGLAELGFERLIITPHFTADVYENTIATVDSSLERLKTVMAEQGITMHLNVSGEYRIDDYLYGLLRQGGVRPLPGDYLLVENPWIAKPPTLLAFLKSLREHYGYKPIMAHPERYPYYANSPKAYRELRQAGVYFQVNLLSLAGFYGKPIKAVAESLLEADMVEFVGTDLHHTPHLQALRDYLCSSDYKKLRHKESSILNDRVFYDA